MKMKTYNIDQEVVKQLGFEVAAYLGCLRDNPGNVIQTGYRAMQKDNPFWSWGKQKKFIDILLSYEAITVEYTDEKKEKFQIVLNDSMLKEAKSKGPVDVREIQQHVAILPVDGQGPTEYTLRGSEIVSKIIELISEINKDAVKYYGWPTERKAILDMLDQGYDPALMLQYADVLKYTHGKPYAPVITSPSEFASKFSKLAAFVVKEKVMHNSTHNKFSF